MKKIYLPLSSVFMASLSFTAIFGQTTFDGELRPRSEFREGFRKPLTDTLNPAFVTLQRTRFNAGYENKALKTRISLQDSRIWGNSDNKTNASKIELYEAWFEFMVLPGFSVKIGRQPLKYDDQRLLSSSDWSNTGISHDIMVLKYKKPFIETHAGFAYNNSRDTFFNVSYACTPKQNYQTMGYVWISKQLYKGAVLSLIGICEGFQKKTNCNIVYPRVTYGGNLVYADSASSWGGTFTAYFQDGKDPNKVYGNGYAALNAFFLAAKGSFKITEHLAINAGIDFYSGSSSTISPDKSNTFNRLYGSTHSFNGSMEYFSTLPAQGLIDYYVGLTTKITSKFSANLTVHSFIFDKDFIYHKVNADKNLGAETDVTLKYAASKEVAIEGGVSMYFNSGSTAQYFKMQNVDTHSQQWAYLMLTIRPQFFKTPSIYEN